MEVSTPSSILTLRPASLCQGVRGTDLTHPERRGVGGTGWAPGTRRSPQGVSGEAGWNRTAPTQPYSSW